MTGPVTYQEVIDHLYNRLPMFSRIGSAAYKADLSNTIALCNATGNPEKKLRCIHVAGTNGKGSVSNMLASVFQEAGYKTGLYTSPHLKDFRERIRINGTMIPEQSVIRWYQELIPVADRIQASFFEMTVAMALSYFIEEQIDIAIIETGLGGRLDSTNVVQPDLSIITNIGLDHQQFLGHTLPEIAAEKAGIIKPKTPVLIGKFQEECAIVFNEKARQLHAPIYYCKNLRNSIQINDFKTIIIKKDSTKIITTCPLKAAYQEENITTVTGAIQIWNETHAQYAIPDRAIQAGLDHVLENTGFMGRWQQLQTAPKVIVDVGHNEDGIKEILKQLQKETYNRLHIVYGAVKDKDVRSILSWLPVTNTSYYFCEPPLPRKLPLEDLVTAAEQMNLPVRYAGHDPQKVYQYALNQADKDDLVLVLGSFFIVGEIL